MSNALIGLIRTAAAAGAGAALAWIAAKLGVTEPLPDLGPFAAAVATSAYWLLAHALERRWRWFGVLLGVPKAPTYNAPTPPAS